MNLCEVPNWIFCSFNESRIVSLILYTLSHDGTIRCKENGPNECSLKHIQVIKKVIKHSKSIYDTSNTTLTSNRHRMSEETIRLNGMALKWGNNKMDWNTFKLCIKGEFGILGIFFLVKQCFFCTCWLCVCFCT